ncbi:DUF6542 domain-containing protein [Actinomycetospora sp. OC33-EN08]|uniref:DUF6542 domain-containing protein n=1 Tax=Actinomycetospora aurantiaca TaxID=3129233 RepID=A0ABU8MJG0_9PSEU
MRDGAATSGPGEVGEASAFPGVRGLRWWAVLVLALVLTAGGVAADVVRTGSLAVVFLAAYPAGCVLAAVLVQRRDIFLPMVQPPLLLAVSVPVAIAATGSLPSSGGTVSTALAVGAPLINGFPAMAITTVVCVVIGFLRIKVQRWSPPESDVRRDPVRSGPAGGAADRDERTVKESFRDRRRRQAADRREAAERREAADRRDAADRRELAERDRRRAQERARAERDRDLAERDRADRERRERDLAERERARRERQETKRPKERPEKARPERDREDDRDRLARGGAEPSAAPAARRSPLKGAGREEQPPAREERMREERLREERRGGPRPPGVHPVRERPPERPPR